MFPNKKKDKTVSYENESAIGSSSEAANFHNTLSNGNHQTYQNEGNENDNGTQQSLTTRQPTSPRQPQTTQTQHSSYIQRPSFGLIDFMLLETLGKLFNRILLKKTGLNEHEIYYFKTLYL
jgi:hypothetical protein